MTNPRFTSLVNGLSSCPHVPRSSPGACVLRAWDLCRPRPCTRGSRQRQYLLRCTLQLLYSPGDGASRACLQACALSCLPVAAFTLLSEVVLGKPTSVVVQLKLYKYDATLTPKAWQPPSTSTLIVAAFLRWLPPAIHLSTSFILTFTTPFATSSTPCPIRCQC